MKKQLLALLTLIVSATTISAMELPRANVDALTPQKVTKLWVAVNNDSKDVDDANLKLIQDLIDQGADPNIDQPNNIRSPMEEAFWRLSVRGMKPEEVERRLKVLKILLSNGKNPIFNSRRLNLGLLVQNMQAYPQKEELLSIVKKYGLLK